MNVVEVHQGNSPVVLGLPHTGTYVPDDIMARLNSNGLLLADTDWHVHRLYDGLLSNPTTVRAIFHRYVIDANRDPAGVSLYPGQNTTGLVSSTDFDNEPIWLEGAEPIEADIAERGTKFHKPYHEALAAELERVRAIHGVAILYDCHSIRSRCPFLFEGVLPDFNIGDNEGTTCDPSITKAVSDACVAAPQYKNITNGRFKGGWTTRHYGQPERGVHAIQMELAQSTHLVAEATPFSYDEKTAGQLRPVLADILGRLEHLALNQLNSGIKP
ncbi:MAG: N-formylglutamate deformylase [Rhizobiaceae bacterium]|nr:N-formylglutamate deformylase [Rhizobiaceae bacterium]